MVISILLQIKEIKNRQHLFFLVASTHNIRRNIMRKKITALALAVLFSVAFAGVGVAAKCKGKVVSNDGNKMVIELDKKCKASTGDSVKIKVKKAAAVEGC